MFIYRFIILIHPSVRDSVRIPIVIVIVIDCRFFFFQKRHPDFAFFLYNYNRCPRISHHNLSHHSSQYD